MATEGAASMHDPRVPETLEGWSVLHQMFRVRWDAWRALPTPERRRHAEEAVALLSACPEGEGATAPVALLGHKGDLMLVHFRRDFEALAAAQLKVAALGLYPYLEMTTSY